MAFPSVFSPRQQMHRQQRAFSIHLRRTHFGNFIAAVRSRKKEDLNAEILEGHYSAALCHLANISYRLGKETPFKDAAGMLKGNDENQETFERFTTHLKSNGIDTAETKIGFGPLLRLEGETFTGELAEAAKPMLTREYRKANPENILAFFAFLRGLCVICVERISGSMPCARMS